MQQNVRKAERRQPSSNRVIEWKDQAVEDRKGQEIFIAAMRMLGTVQGELTDRLVWCTKRARRHAHQPLSTMPWVHVPDSGCTARSVVTTLSSCIGLAPQYGSYIAACLPRRLDDECCRVFLTGCIQVCRELFNIKSERLLQFCSFFLLLLFLLSWVDLWNRLSEAAWGFRCTSHREGGVVGLSFIFPFEDLGQPTLLHHLSRHHHRLSFSCLSFSSALASQQICISIRPRLVSPLRYTTLRSPSVAAAHRILFSSLSSSSSSS